MRAQRDLLEAQSFGRRRLVTAFVSGRPGGHEAEPTRPLRPVLGGLALAVLLLAGAAVSGQLAPRTPADWLSDGNLVVSRAGGDRYLVRTVDGQPQLQPFANALSARLLLGDQDTVEATATDLAAQPVGPRIGIADAPADVPAAARLVQDGWTACTRAGAGIALTLADPAGAAVVPGGAQVVSVGGRTYLLTDQGRPASGAGPDRVAAFELAPRRTDLLLDQLGWPASPVAVDATWLSLVAVGAVLARRSFDVGAPGRLAYGAAAGAPRLRAGQLATSGGVTYLATQTGLAPLTPFARAVWLGLGRDPVERPITGVPLLRTDAFPATWPETEVQPVPGDPCLRLQTGPGVTPTVRVATAPDGVRPAGDPTDNPTDGLLDGLAPGRVRVAVPPGSGSLVDSGALGSTTRTFLIAADGRSYPLADDVDTTLAHLGYAGVVASAVPWSWLLLLPAGPALSADLAGRSLDDPAAGR